MVHNNDTLTNTEKFHYLKASLKGAESSVIRFLYVSEDNCTIAKLKNRGQKTKSRTCSLEHTCIEEEIILWTETVVGRHEEKSFGIASFITSLLFI